MNRSELLSFLCENSTDEATIAIGRWIRDSKRFHDFAADNRTKIRKKLRSAATRESLRSVLLELDVARHFVEDRRCLVEYERYGQSRLRSPDLTVTFRDRTAVNLEVTLVQGRRVEIPEWEGKVIGVVCHKLGQMMPESHNVLIVAPDRGSLSIEHVTGAMKRLKDRMERREADLLSRSGFADPSGFFKQFQWLSGIAVWIGHEYGTEKRKGLWDNPQTRRPLPVEMASLIVS